MELDKCFIEQEHNYWGHKVSFIYFKCPNGHNHDICIPITEGPHFIAHVDKIQVRDDKGNWVDKVKKYCVWHYDIKDGKVYLTPSLDCSESDYCKFHDFFSFKEIVANPEDIWK